MAEGPLPALPSRYVSGVAELAHVGQLFSATPWLAGRCSGLSGLRILDSGLRIPGSGLWTPDSGLWIRILGFGILDSGILYSGILGFWILDSGILIWPL